MAYPSSVGCDLGGDQPTGYAILSACFHTPEITITHDLELVKELTFHTALAFALLAMIAIMAIYNLLLYFSVRDSVYLIYVAASLSALAYACLLTNIAVYFVDASGLNPKQGFLAGLVTFIIHVLLFQRLLDTGNKYPRIHKLASVIAATGFIWLILSPLLTYDVLVLGWMVLGYPVYFGALFIAFQLAKSGYHPARYFIVGWVPYLVAVILTGVEYASLIEPTNWVSYFVPVALAWEMALFSLALASRIKILRDERDTLQAQQIEVSEKAREALARISHEEGSMRKEEAA